MSFRLVPRNKTPEPKCGGIPGLGIHVLVCGVLVILDGLGYKSQETMQSTQKHRNNINKAIESS
jgi:hypothetical protein